MILITGATGKLGSQVIQTLLRNHVPPTRIAALVRDEAKAAHLKELGKPLPAVLCRLQNKIAPAIVFSCSLFF